MSADERVPVAVLGATGIVGQHLVMLLDGHPTLRLAEIVGSAARRGARYGASVDWVVGPAPPREAAELVLRGGIEGLDAPLVLSALPTAQARVWEPALAAAGRVVCTNASAHRMEPGVPLLVPEVNATDLGGPGHIGWEGGGALVANPNCVVTGLALAMAPIERAWGIESGVAVTLQALSGAGLSGPSALALTGNVVPWIPGEEEKIEAELRKILRSDLRLAVAVNRVPVVDGHTAHLFLTLGRRTSVAEVREALATFEPTPEVVALPSIPARPIAVLEAPDRPQPRLDAGRGSGMTVSVGRIRTAPPHDVALTLVVHNAIRGAAGACLANAELCVARGLVGVPAR